MTETKARTNSDSLRRRVLQSNLVEERLLTQKVEDQGVGHSGRQQRTEQHVHGWRGSHGGACNVGLCRVPLAGDTEVVVAKAVLQVQCFGEIDSHSCIRIKSHPLVRSGSSERELAVSGWLTSPSNNSK